MILKPQSRKSILQRYTSFNKEYWSEKVQNQVFVLYKQYAYAWSKRENVHKILLWKPAEKALLGRPRRR